MFGISAHLCTKHDHTNNALNASFTRALLRLERTMDLIQRRGGEGGREGGRGGREGEGRGGEGRGGEGRGGEGRGGEGRGGEGRGGGWMD